MTAPPPTVAPVAPAPPPRRRGAPASVLYDAPGPRTRRMTLIFSAVAAVALAGLIYLLVVRPLASHGQFSREKWGSLVDPSNESFVLLWHRLWEGFVATLIAAVLAIATSLVFGTLLATLRVQLKDLGRRRFSGLPAVAALALRVLSWLLNAITRVCVEVFRGLPVVITIFFVGRGLPEYGLSFDNALWYVVIGLTIYNMVVIGEILRSGMEGLPTGQREAAMSMGLSPFQTTRMILLPQSYRIMLPALISQLVVVLKDTSLGFIVSYEELLNVAKLATQVLHNPIQLYFAVGVIYILVNYGLSKLAVYVQRRLARSRTALPVEAAQPPAAVAADL